MFSDIINWTSFRDDCNRLADISINLCPDICKLKLNAKTACHTVHIKQCMHMIVKQHKVSDKLFKKDIKSFYVTIAVQVSTLRTRPRKIYELNVEISTKLTTTFAEENTQR